MCAFGAQVRDDAYITLRYAERLAGGDGFVYNPGEKVLGTSAPLFALLVALTTLAGLPADRVAVVIGIISDIVAAFLLYWIGAHVGSSSAGQLAALMYSVAVPVVAYSVSGMETPLYVALTLAAFVAWASGRWLTAGVVAGALAVLRPDGLLVGAMLLGWEVLGLRRLPLRGLVAGLTVMLPWAAFAWLYFGSPVPQSVVAKFGLGAEDRLMSLRHFALYFTDLKERFFLATTLAFAVGVPQALGHRLARALLLWAGLYALAFIIANKFVYPIMPFEWYFLPILPTYVFVASLGALRVSRCVVSWLQGRRVRPRDDVRAGSLRAQFELALAAFVTIVVFVPILADQRGYLTKIVDGREGLYKKLAESLARYGARDDLVAATEIGALGYYYPGPILDVSGLVSPIALEQSFGSLVYAFRPPWIVSYDTLVPDELKEEAWFRQEYRPVRQLMNWEGRIATLYRRYDRPILTYERGIALGGIANLQDYKVEVKDVFGGARVLRIKLFWHPKEVTELPYTIFVHLVDRDGRMLGQQDNEPQEGTLSTTAWARDRAFSDLYDLLLSNEIALSDALLEIGAYETGHPDRLLSWTTRGGTALGPYLRLPLLPPQEPLACGIQLGPWFALQQARLAATEDRFQVQVSLLWQTRELADKDYTVFVHLLGDNGQIIAQHDGQPRGGQLPTTVWLPGETVLDEHVVSLNPVLLQRVKTIAVGMYDLKTGARVKLVRGDGDTIIMPMDALRRAEQLDLCQYQR